MSIISANATSVLWFATANAPRFAKGGARVIEKRSGRPEIRCNNKVESLDVLSHVEETEQIRGDKGVEIFSSKVRERLVKKDARVIHQDIDASKIPDCCSDSVCSRLLLADIALKQEQAGSRSQLWIWVSRGRDDVVADFQKSFD